MAIQSLQNSNFYPEAIPQFTTEGYELLQEFGVEIPKGTNTLASRVQEFNDVKENLDKETSRNKVMPWVVAAIEITLIAATVLGFVFGGPLGFIPLGILVIFDLVGAIGSGWRADIGPIPPIGAIFVIFQLVQRQSQLESRHQALSQELPGALQEATVFWQKQGADLLQKVQEAARQVSFLPSEIRADESFEQMAVRLEADRQQAQMAHNRRAAFEAMAQQIQIGQQLSGSPDMTALSEEQTA